MILCKNGHKTVLAFGIVSEFDPDPEPYKADVEEDVSLEDEDIYVRVGIHYCLECHQVVDTWIEAPDVEAVEQYGEAEDA